MAYTTSEQRCDTPSESELDGYFITDNVYCKACGRQFAADAMDRIIAPEQRTRIEHLLCERISLRGICRTVGVSLT